MNRRGVVLIVVYMVIGILTILGIGFMARSFCERYATQRQADSINAFWLAEAGINRAIYELEDNFDVSGNDLWSESLSKGGYSVDVQILGDERQVTARGTVPATGPVRAQRIVEAMMSESIPPNFYDNAVYSAGDIDFNGNSYSVTGDVIYADDADIEHPENINGTVTNDPQISPLARFDFAELHTISEGQGNVYDVARLFEVQKGNDSFPDSFWYVEPTDPNDPTTGIPNIVYVESDLQLNGNIGTIGGFFIVVGDVVTNPDDEEDMTINGNGQIDGLIYTRGEFRINGGGGNLNVNGGVWAGEEIRLNGNAHIAHNQDFMAAVDALDVAGISIITWRDTQSPF